MSINEYKTHQAVPSTKLPDSRLELRESNALRHRSWLPVPGRITVTRCVQVYQSVPNESDRIGGEKNEKQHGSWYNDQFQKKSCLPGMQLRVSCHIGFAGGARHFPSQNKNFFVSCNRNEPQRWLDLPGQEVGRWF